MKITEVLAKMMHCIKIFQELSFLNLEDGVVSQLKSHFQIYNSNFSEHI